MTSTRETAAIVALLRLTDLPASQVTDLIQDHGGAVAALARVVAQREHPDTVRA